LLVAEARGGELKEQLERLQDSFTEASKAMKGRARRSAKPKAEEGGPSRGCKPKPPLRAFDSLSMARSERSIDTWP
jgi:hypothetical protein